MTHLKRTEKEILEEKGGKGEEKSFPLFSTGRIKPLFFFFPSCGMWDLNSPTRD